MRRYIRASFKLAEAARTVDAQSHLFWDNQAPFLSLSNVPLDAVIARLGDAIAPRLRRLREWRDRFEEFHD